MAQKPATPAPRKTEAAKKPTVKAPAAKPVKKAGGTEAAPPGNLDALVNKYLAAFRNAEKALADAKALAATYRERYPELAAYLPEGAAEERALELREDAADEAAGSHRFRIRVSGKEPRYEVGDAGEKASTSTWRPPLGCRRSRTTWRCGSPKSFWPGRPPKARNNQLLSNGCP